MYIWLRSSMTVLALSLCTYSLAIGNIVIDNDTNETITILYTANQAYQKTHITPGIVSTEKQKKLDRAENLTRVTYRVGNSELFQAHIPQRIDRPYHDAFRDCIHQPGADACDPNRFDAILRIMNKYGNCEWLIAEKSR